MSESKNTKQEASGLQKRFDAYCCSVIRKRAFKQMGKYIRYCKNYTAVSIEDVSDETLSTEDEAAIEKFVFNIEGEEVLIDDEFLADAIIKMQDRMRNVLLLNVALEHSLSEIAAMLDIGYNTAKVYKSMALNEIRRKVDSEDGEN